MSDWTSSTTIDVCNIKQNLKQYNICFWIIFGQSISSVKSSAFPQPSCEISLQIRLEPAYIKLPKGAISLFLRSLQCSIYDSERLMGIIDGKQCILTMATGEKIVTAEPLSVLGEQISFPGDTN